MKELWVIYERPKDYPQSFVLRRRLVTADMDRPDLFPTAVSKTLDEVRACLPKGLTRIQGPGQDTDPYVLEVWC